MLHWLRDLNDHYGAVLQTVAAVLAVTAAGTFALIQTRVLRRQTSLLEAQQGISTAQRDISAAQTASVQRQTALIADQVKLQSGLAHLERERDERDVRPRFAVVSTRVIEAATVSRLGHPATPRLSPEGIEVSIVNFGGPALEVRIELLLEEASQVTSHLADIDEEAVLSGEKIARKFGKRPSGEAWPRRGFRVRIAGGSCTDIRGDRRAPTGELLSED